MALYVDIQKSFGNFHLNVQFETGNEMLGLLGASGCGKSVTLRCIAGIEKPDKGRIVLDERVLFDSEKGIDLKVQQRRVGYLFQQYALFPNMSVAQNVEAGVRRGSRKEKRRIAAETLRALRLEGTEHKTPHQLSGGQQQRVALARILVNEPQLILLDEPFSALDSYLKWQMEAELMDSLNAFPGGAILVTHDRDEVYRNCKRLCVLNEGKSEPVEETKALFANPHTLSAARLSGCKNYAEIGQCGEDGSFSIPMWNIQLNAGRAAHEATTIGIRAHQLYIAAPGEKNSIPCRVLRTSEELFGMTVTLMPEGAESEAPSLRLELSKDAWQKAAGDTVSVAVAPEHILLLS